jgi:hypothetical protein
MTAGCVIGSSDENTPTDFGGSSGTGAGGKGGGGSGGKGGSTSGGVGGATTGGATSGGSGGATAGSGGMATGGTAGTGGMATFSCMPVSGTPHGCVPPDPMNPCDLCIQAKCCTEWSNCYGTNPDDRCGWGGPSGQGEVFCYLDCMSNPSMYISVNPPVANTMEAIVPCSTACITPPCSTEADTTNLAITCLNANCDIDCNIY